MECNLVNMNMLDMRIRGDHAEQPVGSDGRAKITTYQVERV